MDHHLFFQYPWKTSVSVFLRICRFLLNLQESCISKFPPSFFGWKSQACCCYISAFKLLTLSLTHAIGHCPNDPTMVLGMTTSRDVPNKQHGQGHLAGIEFTTMDLLSHWPQGWRSGYGTFNFLAQTGNRTPLPWSPGAWVKPNSEVLQTDPLLHLSQTTGNV